MQSQMLFSDKPIPSPDTVIALIVVITICEVFNFYSHCRVCVFGIGLKSKVKPSGSPSASATCSTDKLLSTTIVLVGDTTLAPLGAFNVTPSNTDLTRYQ